ncbi:UNVERIFIED_CONTAM: putative mitochondrial protein [Sesamum indicum]
MENTSIRSDFGIVQPPDMPPPPLNSNEFPPFCSQLDRADVAEPNRPAAMHQPNLQDLPPAKAAQPPPVTQNQAKKSFMDAVNSQSTSASFPKAIQHSYLAGAPPIKLGEKMESQGLPKIQFSVAETERLSEQYKFAIVGKFSHGFPRYRNMHQLLSMLKLQGPFTVTMITNRHVLINLKNEADYTKLWIQRLWHIDGIPMRTFKWTPSFRPQQESSLAPIWIRFPTLPAHLFHKDSLYAIASLVGTPLKLDEPTLFQSRLTAARVCVEVDLANKLIEEIVIEIGNEEVVQKVIFENLPKYCMLCKHVGHEAQNCYTKGNAPKPQRFFQQQKGKATGQKEKSVKHAENVIFEIGEPSKRKEYGVPPGDIKSKNTFHALHQAEDEGEDGRAVEHASVDRNAGTGKSGDVQTKVTTETRYQSELPNSSFPHANTNVPLAPQSCADINESLNPLPQCLSIVNHIVTIERSYGISAFNLCNEDEVNIHGHCEGEQSHECTLNQAPMVDDTDPDIGLGGSREEDLDHQNSEPPSEEKTPAKKSSWEDAAKQSQKWRPTSPSIMIKILLWNIHGIGEPHKQKPVHWLCQKHKPKILVIIEPKVYFDETFFCRRLGFHKVVSNVNSKIWCFMDNSMNCDILSSSEQFLHLRLSTDLLPHDLTCTWVYAKHTRAETRELWNDIRSIDPGNDPWLLGEISTLSLKLAKGKEERPLKSGLWRTLATCYLTVASKMLDLKGHSSLGREIDFGKDLTDSFTPIHGSTHSPSPASNTSPEMSLTTVPYYSRHLVILRRKLRHYLVATPYSWPRDVQIPTETLPPQSRSENLKFLKYLAIFSKTSLPQSSLLPYLWRNATRNKRRHKKRKQSHIHAIQHNGTTLTKLDDIKDSVVDYFKRVFTEEEEVSEDPLLWIPQLLSEEDIQHLGCAPTLEEIKAVVFDICPDSTAGPDGFTSHFYQSCWDIIAEDLMGAVLDFFSRTPPPKNFTTATIVLIPKTENPETWKDFRPISLYNVAGKILSKIMNNQVAAAFLNASHPPKMDSCKGWIAKVRMLIENCWFNILLNGEGAGFFKSTRGLHQGDPLSPKLFVVAAECLSRGLNNLFEQHPRLQYFTRCSLPISHLAFADDVIIFSKGNRKELTILMEFLQRYEAILGQRINREKSSFTVDKKTSNLRIQCIQQVTGFRLKHLPITYLGAPLFKGNKKVYSLMISSKKQNFGMGKSIIVPWGETPAY